MKDWSALNVKYFAIPMTTLVFEVLDYLILRNQEKNIQLR